jgi:hypothetical protein
MHLVLHFPFSQGCPVRFKTGILQEAVSYSPIQEACITILDAIHPDKGLKLTQNGNLPRKVVSDISNLHLLKNSTERFYLSKTLNEHDYIPAAMANALLRVAGITRLQCNKMHITKRGRKVLLIAVCFTVGFPRNDNLWRKCSIIFRIGPASF